MLTLIIFMDGPVRRDVYMICQCFCEWRGNVWVSNLSYTLCHQMSAYAVALVLFIIKSCCVSHLLATVLKSPC